MKKIFYTVSIFSYTNIAINRALYHCIDRSNERNSVESTTSEKISRASLREGVENAGFFHPSYLYHDQRVVAVHCTVPLSSPSIYIEPNRWSIRRRRGKNCVHDTPLEKYLSESRNARFQYKMDYPSPLEQKRRVEEHLLTIWRKELKFRNLFWITRRNGFEFLVTRYSKKINVS